MKQALDLKQSVRLMFKLCAIIFAIVSIWVVFALIVKSIVTTII